MKKIIILAFFLCVSQSLSADEMVPYIETLRTHVRATYQASREVTAFRDRVFKNSVSVLTDIALVEIVEDYDDVGYRFLVSELLKVAGGHLKYVTMHTSALIVADDPEDVLLTVGSR